MMSLESPYLEKVFKPKELRKIVSRVSKNIKILQKKLKFDTIAFTGSSGASIAFPVSMKTGIKLMHIRKKDNSHGEPIEGTGFCDKYIILDDMISTGATIRRMLKVIKKHAGVDEYPECVGIALYYYSSSEWDYRNGRNFNANSEDEGGILIKAV